MCILTDMGFESMIYLFRSKQHSDVIMVRSFLNRCYENPKAVVLIFKQNLCF